MNEADDFFSAWLRHVRTGLPELEIRPCMTPEELAGCVTLHGSMWRFAPPESLNTRFLTIAQITGGHVYGAYDGARLIAFALAFAGVKQGRPYLHSNIAAVLPEYQNRGIGRLLKLYQRQRALEAGLSRIEWTFDPLELRNAYFNIRRLGAVMRIFLPNLYGVSTSPLHSDLPTDRLLAEWDLASPHVKRALKGCAERLENALTIRVPAGISELRRNNGEKLRPLQEDLRMQLQEAFAARLVIKGFVLDQNGGQYLLCQE
jgi:predicted GNAT superfamily acetyltransferase